MHHSAGYHVKRKELLSELIVIVKIPPSPISHSQAGASFHICPEDHNEVVIFYQYCMMFRTFSISC